MANIDLKNLNLEDIKNQILKPTRDFFALRI